MTTILFAALCVAYDAGGACTDRQVFPAGMWEGSEAPVECEAELIASRKRLEDAGHDRHLTLYCETEHRGE